MESGASQAALSGPAGRLANNPETGSAELALDAS
jgi:hypothetical protein